MPIEVFLLKGDNMNTGLKNIDITTGWVNLNTVCNNRCTWCYRKDDLIGNPRVMPFEVATQTVDFFADLGIFSVIFIGGEPTLYPELNKLVEQAKKRQIPEVTVVSNGRLFKKPELVNRLVEAGLDVFSISIHGANREIHDRISGVASWDESIEGIKNVVAAGQNCSVNIVAGPQNYESIPDSIPQILNLGVAQIIVSCSIPFFAMGKIEGDNALDPKVFARLVEKIADAPRNVVILHELPLCLIPRQIFLRLIEENRLGYGCHIGEGKGLSIDVDGTVTPCNSIPNHPIMELFDDSRLLYTPEVFMEVWSNDEEITAIREQANVYRSEICQRCDLWKMCTCGCPLAWGHFDPADYITEELLGIKAELVYNPIKKGYNP